MNTVIAIEIISLNKEINLAVCGHPRHRHRQAVAMEKRTRRRLKDGMKITTYHRMCLQCSTGARKRRADLIWEQNA